MNEEKHSDGHRPGGYVRFIDWLDTKLRRPLGPPPVGPYDAVVRQVGEAVCPVCGRPMAEHTIDHSGPNAVLHCPAAPRSEPPDDGVNELGMKKGH
ncbi:MAG: hypothetical protein H7311_10850 [Ramlibacter sp.]|nr:hypothetical protein [Cryobacterium sp.]